MEFQVIIFIVVVSHLYQMALLLADELNVLLQSHISKSLFSYNACCCLRNLVYDGKNAGSGMAVSSVLSHPFLCVVFPSRMARGQAADFQVHLAS